MKRSFFIIISLLFIIGCDEDPLDNFYSEKIVGRYDGDGNWINGHDRGDQIYFSLGSEVSNKDGYYLLKFDDHPVIHLPELKLEFYEIKKDKNWVTTIYYFDLQENPFFIIIESKSRNYIFVRPPPLYRASVAIDLRMKSKDPDSLYIIQYHGEYNY